MPIAQLRPNKSNKAMTGAPDFDTLTGFPGIGIAIFNSYYIIDSKTTFCVAPCQIIFLFFWGVLKNHQEYCQNLEPFCIDFTWHLDVKIYKSRSPVGLPSIWRSSGVLGSKFTVSHKKTVPWHGFHLN